MSARMPATSPARAIRMRGCRPRSALRVGRERAGRDSPLAVRAPSRQTIRNLLVDATGEPLAEGSVTKVVPVSQAMSAAGRHLDRVRLRAKVSRRGSRSRYIAPIAALPRERRLAVEMHDRVLGPEGHDGVGVLLRLGLRHRAASRAYGRLRIRETSRARARAQAASQNRQCRRRSSRTMPRRRLLVPHQCFITFSSFPVLASTMTESPPLLLSFS